MREAEKDALDARETERERVEYLSARVFAAADDKEVRCCKQSTDAETLLRRLRYCLFTTQ